jgi:hypothetical protein
MNTDQTRQSRSPLRLARRGAVVVAAGLLGVSLGFSVSPARAAPSEIAKNPNEVRGDEITAAQQDAVRKGLEWLSKQQQRDGRFGAGGEGFGASSGITALAGIAFMAEGNLPGRGKYGDNVQRAVDYIIRSSQESGLLASETAHGVMYSHGFATLFLAEVYGMTQDEQVKEKLQKAVRLIQKTQNPQGGWRYMPVPVDADISVTICQVMALRAARDAGIKVEKDVIDKAVAYVRKCQNPDGGFSYMLSANGRGEGGSAFPRSAAGVATLYYAGIFEGEELKRGLAYLRQFTPGKSGAAGNVGGHYYYGHYYGVQAMFLAGGEYWGAWYPAIREELLRRQDRTSGRWSGEINDEYATACALIVLQMPNRYLPVFSGKGPGS